MSTALRSTALLSAAAALGLSACSAQAHRRSNPAGLGMPVMPLAQGHLPPVPTTTPEPDDEAVIPMQIAGVSRRGHRLHVAWDAPGATLAVVSFSADGATFKIVARTTDPGLDFTPVSAHGIIRVVVTDGKRRNSTDYRI